MRRDEIVQELLDKWGSYCDRNWISQNYNDPFCPENKVKLFLNGVAYFLMVGNTEGIVTDYKEIMNGKREIPISSCPSYIEDAVYGGGATIAEASADEDTHYKAMVERLDARADKKYSPASRKASRHTDITKSKKIEQIKSRIGSCVFDYPVVDTNNVFYLRGKKYRIAERVEQYRPKQTDVGLQYDMDHIVCVTALSGGTIHFFDMDMNMQDSELVVEESF